MLRPLRDEPNIELKCQSAHQDMSSLASNSLHNLGCQKWSCPCYHGRHLQQIHWNKLLCVGCMVWCDELFLNCKFLQAFFLHIGHFLYFRFMLRLWNRKYLACFSHVASVTLDPKSFINLRLSGAHSLWTPHSLQNFPQWKTFLMHGKQCNKMFFKEAF